MLSEAQQGVIYPHILTGVATVIADARLTLLSVNDAFQNFFGHAPDAERHGSLAALLPPDKASRLTSLLLSGLGECQWRESVERNGKSTLLQIEASRDNAVTHGELAVYHLLFIDLTVITDIRRDTDFERRKYDIISDLTEDIPFEYDFLTDTMNYAEKYRKVFGRDSIIPNFRQRLKQGEEIDPINVFFRSYFEEMTVPQECTPECLALTSDGRRWFSLFCTKWLDHDGTPLKAVGALRDIDRQKREQLRLLDKSRTDPMTGLLNKTTTEEEIRKVLVDVHPGSMGALLMLDLDNFKKVNDTLGHLAGDAVLIQLARQLLRTFRGEDIVGRVGGDEFHVYMRNVRDRDSVQEKAQEICSAVRKLFLGNELGGATSISVGVACAEDPLPYGELFRQADVALYQAKARGKNRYEFFGDTLRGDEEDLRGSEMSPLASRVTRNSIVVDILDTLFSVEDMHKGIDKALEFIGNALEVDAILLYEKSFDFKNITLSYEWTARPEWRSCDLRRSFPVEELRLPAPATPGGIFYCSDVHSLPDDERTFTKDPAVTSFLQCDIVRDGVTVGMISFEERGNKRIWNQQEIDALTLMAKLINGNISQYRASSLLRRSTEATRDILNSLPGTFVCVISKSHRLLYCNDKIFELFPLARIGQPCFELFQKRDTCCPDCPCAYSTAERPNSFLLRNSAFGGYARASVSNILWENREAAYVLLISEYAPTPEEQGQQNKKEAYAHALCDTYDYVMDIDSDTDRYELLALAETIDILLVPAGDYSTVIQQLVQSRIAVEDRELFLGRFSLDSMLKAFAAGAPAVELEYRWQAKGSPECWKNRLALPYNHDDGSRHILTYVRDITDQKESELRNRAEEAGYLLALQSNYAEIFKIDLKTQQLSPLYYNSEQVPISSGEMDLQAFIRKRSLGRVHPDSREAVEAFFNPDGIRIRISQGETIEVEYRKRQSACSEFRRISATILPVPDNAENALLLLRDVTRSRESEANYLLALQSNYSEIFEINLETEHVSPLYRNSEQTSAPADVADYLSFMHERAREKVHPDDYQDFMNFYDPIRVRTCLERGETTEMEYRKRHAKDNEFRWFSSTLRPVPGSSGKALNLLRDITEQKKQEEERHKEAQRFSLALRGAYTEIYELDMDADTSTLVFSSDTQLVPVGIGTLVETSAIIDNALHPDDRDHVAASFNGKYLRQCFERGVPEITEEFRRISVEGVYHWVSAAIVPLHEGNTLSNKSIMLIKDISLRKEEEQRKRITDQYFLALRNIYDLVYEFNVTRNTYRSVHCVEGKYAMPPEEGELNDLVGYAADILLHKDDSARIRQFLDVDTMRASHTEYGEHHIGEFRTLRRDGRFHWVSITVLSVPSGESGGDEIYLVFFMDIDAWKQAEEFARQNASLERQRLDAERYRIIVDQTNTLVFEWNVLAGTRYISPELAKRFAGNYNDRDFMEIWRDDDVIHSEDRPKFVEFLRKSHTEERPEMTIRLQKREGGYIWCKVVLACLRDQGGRPCRYIGTINDVDAVTRSVAALQYRAEYDPLTGIFNTTTFYARAEALLRGNPEHRWSVIRLDIDRFKVINDLYGMSEGDLLLQTIARRLTERIHEHGVCGRISGDVFCACIDLDRDAIVQLVHDITDELAEYPLASRIVPSFGICEVENTNTPINVLCDWASLALKTVKGNVLVYHAFYDGTLRERILDEKKIETEMHTALARGEFQLYLQPKVHIPSGRIMGAEGLVRWQHPVEGVIQPDRFIPLFERNGFVINLDEYIWDQTCQVLRRWIDRGITPLPVSVNVSRMHVHDTRLQEKLIALLSRYSLPPHLLELELTESVFLDSEQPLIETIHALQKRGFVFSLDDFGAGYSSLNMLKSLPIDTIKIDRGFLNEVTATDRGKTVIRHTIALARAMDMKVVAEGVETNEQANFLMNAECSVAQGFYYSPPIPVAAFEHMAFDGGKETAFPPCPETSGRER